MASILERLDNIERVLGISDAGGISINKHDMGPLEPTYTSPGGLVRPGPLYDGPGVLVKAGPDFKINDGLGCPDIGSLGPGRERSIIEASCPDKDPL